MPRAVNVAVPPDMVPDPRLTGLTKVTVPPVMFTGPVWLSDPPTLTVPPFKSSVPEPLIAEVEDRVVVLLEKLSVAPVATAKLPESVPPPPRSRVPELASTTPELLRMIPLP